MQLVAYLIWPSAFPWDRRFHDFAFTFSVHHLRCAFCVFSANLVFGCFTFKGFFGTNGFIVVSGGYEKILSRTGPEQGLTFTGRLAEVPLLPARLCGRDSLLSEPPAARECGIR